MTSSPGFSRWFSAFASVVRGGFPSPNFPGSLAESLRISPSPSIIAPLGPASAAELQGVTSHGEATWQAPVRAEPHPTCA